MNALLHEGAEGDSLAHGPVDGPIVDHVHPGFVDPVEAFVDDEVGGVGRTGGDALADVGQGLFMDSSGIALLGQSSVLFFETASFMKN